MWEDNLGVSCCHLCLLPTPWTTVWSCHILPDGAYASASARHHCQSRRQHHLWHHPNIRMGGQMHQHTVTGCFYFVKEVSSPLILSFFFFFCNLGHGAVDRYSHGKHKVKQMGAEHMLCICNVRMSDMGIFSLQVGDRRPSAKLHIAGKCKWASSPSDCS